MNTWHSENLDALAPALVATQGALSPVKTDETAKMGTFSYTYATMAACREHARPVLLANGLSLSQFPTRNEAGRLSLLSILLHKSGQWLACEYPLADAESERMNPHQAEKSALSYAARTSFCLILGIATEDDDAASASRPRAGKEHVDNLRAHVVPAGPVGPGSLPVAVTFGKNKGKLWKELAAESLDWYAKEAADAPVRAAAAAEQKRRADAATPAREATRAAVGLPLQQLYGEHSDVTPDPPEYPDEKEIPF